MKKFSLTVLTIALGISLLAGCNSQSSSAPEEETLAEETATTDEATAEVADKLFVYGDIVSSAGCVLQSRFTVGDRIVFRMNVQDALTGEQPEDAKVMVHLSTGESLEMHLGDHPPGAEDPDRFWTVGYTVTEDTPTGTMQYYVTAETADKSGEYRLFNVEPSLLTIVAPEEMEAGEADEAADEEAEG